MGPFPLESLLGHTGTYLLFLLIGMGFGAALELSGFARSTKLTAQFYLRDMTVFKVMFTAVLLAMVLLFGAAGLGLLDYDRIWVPPTYLVPGTLGGLLLGIGFIIGGFCPGTSLTGLATLKKDAVFFIVGILGGIILFGETSGAFGQFWESTFMGRYTLPELLGLPVGVTVFVVCVVGVLALAGAELLERAVRRKDGLEVDRIDRRVFAGAGVLILAGFAVMVIGQPTAQQRWERVASEKQTLLDNREVQIQPVELKDLYYNPLVNLVMLDLRDESNYNLFHIKGAARVRLDRLEQMSSDLKAYPEGTVAVLMSNDEAMATEGWKLLAAYAVPNVYILEGGINHFIGTRRETPFEPISGGEEYLRFEITAALGGNHPESTLREHGVETEYTPKVKLQKKAPTGGGGCG